MLYDLIKEVKKDIGDMAQKNNEHREETIKWNAEASYRLCNIEEDLRDHKEGVVQNREVLKKQDIRISRLEGPIKEQKAVNRYKENLRKHWKYWLGIGFTVAGIVSKLAGLW